MSNSAPKGSTLQCSIIFLEGEFPHKTDKKNIVRDYDYSGDLNELKIAKKDAFDFFLKYVKDFDDKYPDGYIMLHKVEWETDESPKKATSIFMKQLEVAGVSSDF